MLENHREALKDMVFDKLSPRSSFAPYLSNDLSDWGDVRHWNASQVALMLECLLIEENGDDWESTIADDMDGNGVVDDVIHG